MRSRAISKASLIAAALPVRAQVEPLQPARPAEHRTSRVRRQRRRSCRSSCASRSWGEGCGCDCNPVTHIVGGLRFHPAAPPTDDEMDHVLAMIERRIRRLLVRRGSWTTTQGVVERTGGRKKNRCWPG